MSDFVESLPPEWSTLTEFQQQYVAVQAFRPAQRLLADFEEAQMRAKTSRQRFLEQFSEMAGWLSEPNALAASSEKERLRDFFVDNGTKGLVRALGLLRGDNESFIAWAESRDKRMTGLGGRLNNLILLRNDAAHGDATSRALTLVDATDCVVMMCRLVHHIDLFVQDEP